MTSTLDEECGVYHHCFRRHDDGDTADDDGDNVDDHEDRDACLTHRIPKAFAIIGMVLPSLLAVVAVWRWPFAQRACIRLVACHAPPNVHFISCVKLIQAHRHMLGLLFMPKQTIPWRRVGF